MNNKNIITSLAAGLLLTACSGQPKQEVLKNEAEAQLRDTVTRTLWAMGMRSHPDTTEQLDKAVSCAMHNGELSKHPFLSGDMLVKTTPKEVKDKISVVINGSNISITKESAGGELTESFIGTHVMPDFTFTVGEGEMLSREYKTYDYRNGNEKEAEKRTRELAREFNQYQCL